MTFRYAALDAAGDMIWGQGPRDFLVDSPAAVAQAVQTRLGLWVGEWFLNLDEGTPWATQVLGVRTGGIRDAAIRQRILGTPYVLSIDNYASSLDVSTATFSVSCSLHTAFGAIAIGMPFSLVPGSVDQGPFQIGYSPIGGFIGVG
jgi:hypothetical protein